MMISLTERNNVVYIDGANLHKGAERLGWGLDYGRLRVWLREKYRVTQAYLLKRTGASIAYLADQQNILSKKEIENKDSLGLDGRIRKEKAPGADGTAQGSFS